MQNNEKIKPQTEQQLAIKSKTDFDNYINSHIKNVFNTLIALDSDIMYSFSINGKYQMTDYLNEHIEKLNDLADEYINYDCQIKEVKNADRKYKYTMKYIKKLVVELKETLNDNSYVSEVTGIKNIKKIVQYTNESISIMSGSPMKINTTIITLDDDGKQSSDNGDFRKGLLYGIFD